MNAIKQLAPMALGVVFAVSIAVGTPQPWPFTDPFDVDRIGTVWVTNDVQGLTVTVTNAAPQHDGDYLRIVTVDEFGGVAVELSGNQSNAWWTAFARVTAMGHDDTPADAEIANAAAAFFLEESNGGFNVRARSNGTWVALSYDLAAPTNNWIGYAVHLDYINEKWDLYLTDQGTNSIFNKANTAGALEFSDTWDGVKYLRSFAITNLAESVTDVDDVRIFAGAGVVDANTPSQIKPATVSHTTNRWYAGKVADKSYASGQDNLGGTLGADLAAGLIPGDMMRVYTTNGWAIYKLEADGLWSLDEGVLPGDAPANVSLVAGEPVWFEYSTVITDAFAFFDPDYDPAVLPDAVIERASIAIRPNATAGGWTTMRWDGSASRQIHPTNQAAFPSSSLDSESVIIVIRGDGTFTRGFWTGSDWETIGGVPIVLQPGNTIWVYNKGTSEPTWTPSYSD